MQSTVASFPCSVFKPFGYWSLLLLPNNLHRFLHVLSVPRRLLSFFSTSSRGNTFLDSILILFLPVSPFAGPSHPHPVLQETAGVGVPSFHLPPPLEGLLSKCGFFPALWRDLEGKRSLPPSSHYVNTMVGFPSLAVVPSPPLSAP